jgi:hypothetical protein
MRRSRDWRRSTPRYSAAAQATVQAPPESEPAGVGPASAATGYWWQCVQGDCTYWRRMRIGPFLWNTLALGNPTWNQCLLHQECPKCKSKSLRITYRFPSTDPLTVHVLHIVGIGPLGGHYLPMMWETYYWKTGEDNNLNDPWFDFKYMRKNKKRLSIWGLNRPAVLQECQLVELFNLYRERVRENFLSSLEG